jgi:citrate synthase
MLIKFNVHSEVIMPAEWINAAEAARRLGVKQASLYSYVSRGVLTRRKAHGSRASLFSASEVEGLARRGRPRRAPGPAELVIETELTEITGDHLRYRGMDAIALARSCELEQVASLLWTGTLADAGHGRLDDRGSPLWEATAPAVAAGSAAQAALPAGTLPLERLQVIVPALAAADPLRLHLDPPAVMAAGRCLIAGMVDCLPVAKAPVLGNGYASGAAGTGRRDLRGSGNGRVRRAQGGTVAERLVPRLCPAGPGAGLIDAVRAALVLLADHELAASTLAARVAASMRADPYAVVATGLGAVGGTLHGGASFGAEVMLRSASGPADAARAVGDLLRRGERIPGFGHFVYRRRDPRAVLLLDLLRAADPGSQRLAVAEAVIAEARGRSLPEPNIDFALAALAVMAGMIPGAGEAIFAVARAAGWVAHALEEYARRTPIRPRGIYTGPVVPPG